MTLWVSNIAIFRCQLFCKYVAKSKKMHQNSKNGLHLCHSVSVPFCVYVSVSRWSIIIERIQYLALFLLFCFAHNAIFYLKFKWLPTITNTKHVRIQSVENLIFPYFLTLDFISALFFYRFLVDRDTGLHDYARIRAHNVAWNFFILFLEFQIN